MDKPEAYEPPPPGSERWNRARAERVRRTEESDDDDLDRIMASLNSQQRPDDFLCPGDWIQYTHIMHVHNHRYHQRYTAIVNTDPDRKYMLSLRNGDLLPNDTMVTIFARRDGDILHRVDKPYELPIDSYLIEKAGDENWNYWRNEAQEIRAIISRNECKLRDQLRVVAETPAEELSGNESTGNKETYDEKSDEEDVSLEASVVIIEEDQQDDEEDGKLLAYETKEELGFSPDMPSINVDMEMAKYRYFQNAPAVSPPGRKPPFISPEASIAGGFNTLSGNTFGGNGMHAFISPSQLQMPPFASANNGNFGARNTGLDPDDRKKETPRG